MGTTYNPTKNVTNITLKQVSTVIDVVAEEGENGSAGLDGKV